MILTVPARIPLQPIITSVLPRLVIRLNMRATIPPEKEASTEVRLARMARIHLLPLIPNVEPWYSHIWMLNAMFIWEVTWLNEIHAHHNMKTPITALVALPMAGSPSLSHLPILGPNILAATRAPAPPTRLTPQLPAKIGLKIFLNRVNKF